MTTVMRYLRVTLGLVLVVGCNQGTEAEPQVISEFVLVSGDNQEARVNSVLPQPLVVQVLDPHGEGIQGVHIAWTVEPGNGTLSPSATTTDRTGKSSVRWTLGTIQGLTIATAEVAEVGATTIPLTFGAIAQP